MANIGQSILALLTGAGQGVQNAQAQAPINAMNNLNVQQAQQGISDSAQAMQYFSAIGLSPNGGGGANPSPPTIPTSGAAPPPVAGNSIVPPSPGQSSVPMTQPGAAAPVPVPVAVQKPPPPATAAPVNQMANQAQSPVENPMLASLQMLSPVLKDPKFQSLTPGAKKIVLSTMMQMQQAQAQQQQQLLRQQNEQKRGQILDKKTAGTYNPRLGKTGSGDDGGYSAAAARKIADYERQLKDANKSVEKAQKDFDSADKGFFSDSKAQKRILDNAKSKADQIQRDLDTYRKSVNKGKKSSSSSAKEQGDEGSTGAPETGKLSDTEDRSFDGGKTWWHLEDGEAVQSRG